MSGSFQEAREALRELRKKLDVTDHILGLMATVADSIRNKGQVPELEYNRATGEVALRVRLGDVPPRVVVTIGQDEEPRPTPVEPKPSLGDLSDRMQDPDWPPERDRELLERMMRGDGAGGTAEAMGIEKHDVLSRWRSLFPDPPTIEEQAAMLAAVKRKTF